VELVILPFEMIKGFVAKEKDKGPEEGGQVAYNSGAKEVGGVVRREIWQGRKGRRRL